MSDDDRSAISVQDARALFSACKAAPAVILAVSGGPDSVAMMWLAARWRRALKSGPRLVAVTVDHGLRPEAGREARDVKRLARELAIEHRTMRWTGAKPKTGIPAAARQARYHLLVQAARNYGATHLLTAHTRDDQAETVLMRMSRGSGLTGLGAMAHLSMRNGITLMRPLLDVPKMRLLTTLDKAGISYADDPTNRDSGFTRPRLRALMPALAAEGCDARNLARLAARMARANVALDLMADGAERYLAARDPASSRGSQGYDFDADGFGGLPEEIRIRLLLRMLDRVGHEGPAEFGKAEALAARIAGAVRSGERLRQTLAGALVTLAKGRLSVVPAPPRRRSGQGGRTTIKRA